MRAFAPSCAVPLLHRGGIQAFRRTFRLFLFALAALSASVQPGVAQEKLSPGARVRITATRWSWELTEALVATRQGDTLILERRGVSEIRLPMADIERLEVSTRPRQSGRYAVFGALVGAAAGFLGARVVLDARYRDDRYNAPAALLIGAPAGALVGVGIGYALGEERWEPVPVAVWTRPAP